MLLASLLAALLAEMCGKQKSSNMMREMPFLGTVWMGRGAPRANVPLGSMIQIVSPPAIQVGFH